MNGADNPSPPPQQNEDANDSAPVAIESSPTAESDAAQIKQETLTSTPRSEETHAKKRKLTEPAAAPRSSRAASPPWKRIAVEGPTSFVEEGKRRSARTNILPLELRPQSSKRQTRASQQELSRSIKSKYKNNGYQDTTHDSHTPSSTLRKTSRSHTKPGTHNSNKPSRSTTYTLTTPPSKRTTRRRTGTMSDKSSPFLPKHETPIPKRRPGRPPRIKRECQDTKMNGVHKSEVESDEEEKEMSEDDVDDSEDLSEDLEELPIDPDFKPQRLKFKVRMPSLTSQHPAHVVLPKRFPTFREWVENVEATDFSDSRMSNEQVRREARCRQRIFEAFQSGSLFEAQSSFDIPDPEPEPTRQYYRQDHFLAHALDMRKRMIAEQKRHIREAKKLMDDLKAYWKDLQPKTEEDVEREKIEYLEAQALAVMRQCISDMSAKWDILRSEVEKQRLAKWEQEQEALGKQALNKVLEQSTQLLDARIRRETSDVSSDEADDEDDSDGEKAGSELGSREESDNVGSNDEDNMSSNDSSEEEDSGAENDDPDEQLTLEELHKKYGQDRVAHAGRPPDGLADRTEVYPSGNTQLDVADDEGAVSRSINDGERISNVQRTLRGVETVGSGELDDSVLDETDESIDMDDDMGDSDASPDEYEEMSSDEDGEDDNTDNLLGFFSKAEIAAVSTEEPMVAIDSPPEPPVGISRFGPYQMLDEEEELDEISLIPDAAEVQTPSASNDGSSYARLDVKEIQPRDATNNNHETKANSTASQNVGSQGETYSRKDVNIDVNPENGVRAGEVEQEHTEERSQFQANSKPVDHVEPYLPLSSTAKLELPLQMDGTASIERLYTDASEPDKQELVEPQQNTSKGSATQTLTPAKENMTPTEAHSIESDHNTPMDMDDESLPATPVSSKPVKTAVPSLLRGTLREYQHFGLDWLAGLYANGTNGILADEMGLGKTIQTISLLAHLAVEHHIWGPHLIVVPTSVMLNWEMEFKKFLPAFKVMTYYGTVEERKQRRKGWLNNDMWNVVITSYNLIIADQTSFKKRAWHYLVLDEAHNIKNFRSQRWQTLLSFRTEARLLLTGTPLQNSLTELWSLMFFLMPSDSTETGIAGFAHLDEFSSWFKKPVDQILEQGRDTMDDEARRVVTKLHSVLRPYLLRRLKADVEKQMPAKYEHVIYCKLSKRQRYLYDGFMSLASTRETLSGGNYLSIINCLMQLRKVCNHPDLFETRQIVTSFRMPKSIAAEYETKELLVRRLLLDRSYSQTVNLQAVNLIPGANGPMSALHTIQSCRLKGIQHMRWIMGDLNRKFQTHRSFDGTSINATLSYMENSAMSAAWSDLHQKVYLTSLRSQRRPLMNYNLIDKLKINLKPHRRSYEPLSRDQLLERLSGRSPLMDDLVLDIDRRAESIHTTIQKFACITPKVVAPDINISIFPKEDVHLFQRKSRALTKNPFHESQTRLSIAFPDKRLLQYDCGKLQKLDDLLRKLQIGGHRALIFTQMTKVLDILEQFLNIHGHRYLRLDGSTRVEQRQILTDRFNNDPRIPVFILSSRSGGLGINLTGADTVIFYDLDWNPAMDKQCQDRCHRIGQTRDVHIYRFVSEYTIEANILRKANQKRLLDDVIIQEGEFTTDFFHKSHAQDAYEDDGMHEADAEASAAMDRVLGTGSVSGQFNSRIFEQAEEKEDIAAAHAAEKEVQHADELDFSERTPAATGATPKASGPMTQRDMAAAAASKGDDIMSQGERKTGIVLPTSEMMLNIFAGKAAIGVDRYMVKFIEEEMEKIPIGPPAGEKRKAKKGSEHVIKRKR